MASLLDVLISRNNPAAGLLARSRGMPGAPPPEDERRDSAPEPARASALGRVFGGSFDPSLSPESNQRTQQQALLLAGLGALSSQQEGIGAVAEGAVLGQQFGAQQRQQDLENQIDLANLRMESDEIARKQAMRAQRRELFANVDLNDPNQRTETMRALLQAGDFDGAQRLNNFESNLPDAEIVEDGDSIRLIDPRTLEEKKTIELPGRRPQGTEVIDRGGTLDLIDKDTGEIVTRFDKRTDPKELRDQMKDRFDMTDKLADDFRSETKGLQEAQRFAVSASGAPATGAGDQTLVVALNKLLDPNSTVREGEFTRVAKVGGFTAQAQQFANRIVSEGELSDQSRESIRAEIDRLAKANELELQTIGRQYVNRANQAGVNPNFVVRSDILGDALSPFEDEDEDEE